MLKRKIDTDYTIILYSIEVLKYRSIEVSKYHTYRGMKTILNYDTMFLSSCPPTPPSTPFPEQTSLYFGWYSPALQQLRLSNPTYHTFRGKSIMGPPYTYWYQGDKRVLVTEITHTSIPTARQVKNGDIYMGPVDKYCCRSYMRLSEAT